MSTEQTRSCLCCSEPYVTYSMYAGDQSACPACRAKAKSPGLGGSTIPCPCCGLPYTTFSGYAGDQSACSSCRARARGMSQFIPQLADFAIKLKPDLRKDRRFKMIKRSGQSVSTGWLNRHE